MRLLSIHCGLFQILHLIDLYFLVFVFVRSVKLVFVFHALRHWTALGAEVDCGRFQILHLIDLYFLDFVFFDLFSLSLYSRTEALDSVGCRS